MPKLPNLILGVLLVFGVAGCAEDPEAGYLKAQPEYSLSYPNSTLISTTSGGDGPIVHGVPYVTREFKTDSAFADVAAWYSKELVDRKWVGGLEPNEEGPGGGATYFWERPCVSLSLDAYPPLEGKTHYEVSFSILAGCEWQRAAAAQSLRDEPVATLAPSGAQPADKEGFGADLQPDGSTLVAVGHPYIWTGTHPQILEFYDASLAKFGWTRVDPPPSEGLGNAATATWQKGQVVAVVTFEGTRFRFSLKETLDSQGSPLPPPSGLSSP